MAEKTQLDNGRTLQPGANAPGAATRGASMHGPWYDNNGDEVPLGSNPEMEEKITSKRFGKQ